MTIQKIDSDVTLCGAIKVSPASFYEVTHTILTPRGTVTSRQKNDTCLHDHWSSKELRMGQASGHFSILNVWSV